MLESIEDLIHARPHMRTSAHWSPEELRAFHEEYYTGVVYALRVAIEAVARYRLATRTRRVDAKRKASA